MQCDQKLLLGGSGVESCGLCKYRRSELVDRLQFDALPVLSNEPPTATAHSGPVEVLAFATGQ